MFPLEKTLRSKLENTIKEARKTAEGAAKAALEQLGVEQPKPYPYLSESQRALRVMLRAHGRQLGDSRNPKTEEQEITRLTEEVAYEHWHRMLFARFLADNGLLMYFDSDTDYEGVPVTLEDCNELAAELGLTDGYELAARMASRMLPQIFRPDSPVFGLTLPPERQDQLEQLLRNLPAQVFTAADSLGWVYQFWQAEEKKRINESQVKVGALELPAVTQLFTEPYMVSSLLDNSLGAWWAAKRLTADEKQYAVDEAGLRASAALPGMPLDYLRFVREKDSWKPAGGTFDAWPQNLDEFKVLDPCCGSGHFLVSAFLMLVPMRMTTEGLTARAACDAVLRDNLHGLEIDRRCVELAAFALAFSAWRYPNSGGYRHLPELNLAWCGQPVSGKKSEWISLAAGDDTLAMHLGELYDLFRNAPVLGSLLKPRQHMEQTHLFAEPMDKIEALVSRSRSTIDDDTHELGVVVQGLEKAIGLLSGRYHLVITNVPYLARGKQHDTLRDYCANQYPDAKNDLATAFLARCLDYCAIGGNISIVLPQNWLFLGTYKKFRKNLLMCETWNYLCVLGEGGFHSSAAAGAFIILLSLTRAVCKQNRNIYGLDVSALRKPEDKAELIAVGEINAVGQIEQLDNPDSRLAFYSVNSDTILNEYAYSFHGLTSGDMPRMKLCFWEVVKRMDIWVQYQSTVINTELYGGMEHYLRWERGKGAIDELSGARKDGLAAWGKCGVLVSQMRKLPVTLYAGGAFDNNTAVIVPYDTSYVPAIWCYCSSPEYNTAVRRIDKKIGVTSATLSKVPFDLEKWRRVAAEQYPNGLPKPYSDDPTQWIFHGHPAASNDPLQVALARLLGYRWPAEVDNGMELSDAACDLFESVKKLQRFADEDGIVCIPPICGEAPAAERLLHLLAAAYPNEDLQARLSDLLTQADHGGRSLESWLRDKFFSQHCKRFQNRPYIWHIWDGLPDGFSALVNYHRLDRRNLEKLIYTYLGEWIERQKQAVANRIDGACDRLAAAEALHQKLELILEGEAPYDIFIRWKPLSRQPVGWEPDINDGVRLNIRPFMSVPDVSKRGAGVLRDKPKIEWGKDRGKEISSAPWYKLGPVYGGALGDRINDHHLTLGEKRQARRRGKPHESN